MTRQQRVGLLKNIGVASVCSSHDIYSLFANTPLTSVTYTADTFAAAWHGGLKNAAQFAQSADLRASISLAMSFWFENDFTDASCLDFGGDSQCPCGTPGLWNTNWFSNVGLQPLRKLGIVAKRH